MPPKLLTFQQRDDFRFTEDDGTCKADSGHLIKMEIAFGEQCTVLAKPNCK